MTHRFRVEAVCALSVAVWLGCESPAAPIAGAERVAVGQVVTGSLDGVDSLRRYSFTAGGGDHAVFLQVLDGSVVLTVEDSATQQPVAQVAGSPSSSGTLEDLSTGDFATQAGVYLVSLRAYPSRTPARYEFRVFQVDPDPEFVPARFVIGDTVAGETINPAVDYDDFVVMGDSGQDIVAVMEVLGPAGSGDMRLTVLDSLNGYPRGSLFAAAGQPALATTGRLRLPRAQDYIFQFRSAGSVTGYTGPYRFWSYLINPTPEHRSAAVPLDSEIQGENIDRAGDIDEFVFQGDAGAEVNAFLQSGRSFRLEVAPGSGPPVASVTNTGADTSLFAQATGRFQLAEAGPYTVRVSGTASTSVADTGPYRFFLYPIDRRPERVPEAIVPGDTVSGEAIDRAGDVDEFTFSATAGDEFNVALQALNGSSATMLQVEAVDATGSLLRVAQSIGADTSLFERVTGRFAVLTTGTHRLRVTGVRSNDGRDSGPYRLFLYRVNRHPESVPDTLVFGDSVSGEAIELPGDVDEFHVRVPDSSGADLLLQTAADAQGGTLTTELLNDLSGQTVAQVFIFQPGGANHTGTLRVGPGSYTLRVQGYGPNEGTSLFRGGYRLWLYKFGFGPESVGDTIALGDTVSGEAIAPLGDVDGFVFQGRPWQHIVVAFQGTASSVTGALQAFVTSPGGYPIVGVSGPTSAASLGDHQSNRIDLTQAGWHRIGVGSATQPVGGLGDRGPYRLAVTLTSVAPEHGSASLAPGDSVASEAIDYPGDWDEFTLNAAPGQMVGVLARSVSGATNPELVAYDSTTGETLGAMVMQGFDKSSGRFVRRPGDVVKIAVFEPRSGLSYCSDATCGAVFTFTGAYRFRVIPVDPAPESVPATFALGDTVRGEAIWPVLDLDEFTSAGTPGETLTAWYRLTADPVPAGGLITLEVVDPATGAVLAGSGVAVGRSSPDYFTPGSFTVPAGGSYMIRVSAYGFAGSDVATAPYEFFLKP